MKNLWLLLFMFLLRVYGEEIEIYKEIVDLTNPTIEELRKIQDYLQHAERPDLKKFWDKEFIPRQFRFIGPDDSELPQSFHAAVNTSELDKENVVIIYSSYNKKYPLGAKRLFDYIIKSDFRGHVECRIGGWPDIEGGGLSLAHVPFAFKVCFFREMQRKGYKRVLWLDASILPVTSLNRVFERIKQKGYFVQANVHILHPPYMTKETAAYFGYTFEEASKLLSCSAAILGIDFSNSKSCELIERWFEAAKDPYAFYTPRSDQTALSLIFHRLGMVDWESPSILGEPNHFTRHTLFIMERSYVYD